MRVRKRVPQCVCLAFSLGLLVFLACPFYRITFESPTSPSKGKLLRKLLGLLLEPLSKMGAGDRWGQRAQESKKTGLVTALWCLWEAETCKLSDTQDEINM